MITVTTTMTYTELLSQPTNAAAADQMTQQFEPGQLCELEPDEHTNAERIRTEFTNLWNIYADRRDGMTMQFGKAIIEDDVIATRYYDERAIEEIYWRTQVYDASLKNGVSETIFIHITTSDGEREIYVSEAGDVTVMHRPDEESEWKPTSSEDADSCLYDFFYRTTIAADIHHRRSPEEQTVANNHAKALLRERYPMLAATKTTEE